MKFLKIITTLACVLLTTSAFADMAKLEKTVKSGTKKEILKEALIEANKDNDIAQYIVGKLYIDGVGGIQKNETEAFKWTLRSANNGNSDAQNLVAAMYQDGVGTTKNTKEALTYYERAIKQNNMDAYTNLSGMYYAGDGVVKDRKKAFDYRMLVATQTKISDNINAISTAQFWLGIQYYLGEGIKKDLKESKRWFIKAKENGHPKADEALKELEGSQAPTPQEAPSS